MPSTTFVTLKVYDVLGKEITTLVNEERGIGVYETAFNASSLTSGVYFYQLVTENQSISRKMILMR
ncbi:MAG: T9SS type A sorting domain-containing protein [Ignavibacteriales bacterium]|nr:T9SS type A sorting domain-containing protein [Ignavibacteriales bacterium]